MYCRLLNHVCFECPAAIVGFHGHEALPSLEEGEPKAASPMYICVPKKLCYR